MSSRRYDQCLKDEGLRCVWTGQPLNRTTLDIDHMFPWTAWPCSDLWNLLPAHRHRSGSSVTVCRPLPRCLAAKPGSRVGGNKPIGTNSEPLQQLHHALVAV